MIENLLLISGALALMVTAFYLALDQLPRLLISYKISENHITVFLLRTIPIYWIPFRKIKALHVRAFYEVVLVPGVHLFTRLFAKRVMIEMRDKWFIFAFFTPDNPDAFIAEVKKRMVVSN